MMVTSTLRGVLCYTSDMKKKTRSQLVKEFDKVFSIYIRRRYGDDATCVTCGVTKPWKEMQAGHFFSRGRYPTRWTEQNVHVQCYRCNVLLKGNYINYTRYMINRYTMEGVDALERKSVDGSKVSTPDLRWLIDVYKDRIKELDTIPNTLDKLPEFGV